jgi:hypothetical protein
MIRRFVERATDRILRPSAPKPYSYNDASSINFVLARAKAMRTLSHHQHSCRGRRPRPQQSKAPFREGSTEPR